MKRILKRAAALQDLDNLAAFIGQDSPNAALRFLEAAEREFKSLAGMPGLGSIWESSNPQCAGLRMWPIPGFANHLIFYRETKKAIEVIRVLHASRDIESIFPE
jgi:toxin ParE1/3/4